MMSRGLFRRLVPLLLVVSFAVTAAAQPPIVLNTQVRSFTPVSGTPWVADIWAHTDSLGRDFALVCRGNSGLSIYEITNPAAPVFAASIPATGSDLKDVKVLNDHAYCVQQNGGIRIVDITDPYSATVVADLPVDAHNCFVVTQGTQDLLFLARSGESPPDVRIYDVTNPTSPVFLASYRPSNENFHDVYVEEGRLYASAFFGAVGTDVADVTNPSNPTFIAKVPTGGNSHACWVYTAPGGEKILCSSDEQVGGHLRLFDVTNPTNAPLLSEYQTDPGISIHNPVVYGRYCFISYYADYLRILDLANPGAPVEVGIFDPWPTNAGAGTFDGAWGVAHVKELPGGAHRVLLTESFQLPRGFWVIDFTPPPVMHLDIQLIPGSGHMLSVTGVDPFTEIYNGVSLITSAPFGTGGLGGLQGDAIATLTFPLGAQPFHVLSDASGSYSFLIPLGLGSGLTVDLLSIGIVGGVWKGSELARYTF